MFLQEEESDVERNERLLQVLEQCESELVQFYAALVATGQRDVVELLRENEHLLPSSSLAA